MLLRVMPITSHALEVYFFKEGAHVIASSRDPQQRSDPSDFVAEPRFQSMRIFAADHSDLRPTQPGEPFQKEIEQFFADEGKYLAGKNMAIMLQRVGRRRHLKDYAGAPLPHSPLKFVADRPNRSPRQKRRKIRYLCGRFTPFERQYRAFYYLASGRPVAQNRLTILHDVRPHLLRSRYQRPGPSSARRG